MKQNDQVSTLEILLVEERHGGLRLEVIEGKTKEFASRIHVVGNGLDAVSFIRREGSFHEAPKPDLIIVDMEHPHINRPRFFLEMKKEGEENNIPMVVCTPTPLQNSAFYILKPLSFPQIASLVKFFKNFALTYTLQPKEAENG